MVGGGVQTGRVIVDGWLEMNAPAQTAVLFKELRGALDTVLQERIGMPQVHALDSLIIRFSFTSIELFANFLRGTKLRVWCLFEFFFY
jgi:hypothetical protein